MNVIRIPSPELGRIRVGGLASHLVGGFGHGRSPVGDPTWWAALATGARVRCIYNSCKFGGPHGCTRKLNLLLCPVRFQGSTSSLAR